MKRAIAVFAIIASGLMAQSKQAVCSYPYKLTGAGATTAQNNIQSGCASWSFTYSGTAPVTVEFSQDGTTWGSTGLTVTSGSLPTTSGYGVVKFTGYAPYLRVKASGSSGQTVSGLLYGSLGLTASSSVPDYVWSLGSPASVKSWTKDSGPHTVTKVSGKDVITFYRARGTSGYGLTCTTYPTPPFTLRVAIQLPIQYWNSDAAKSFAIIGRDPSVQKWLVANVSKFGENIEPLRCSGGTTPGNCSTVASYWGSPFFNSLNTTMSTNWPVVYEWKDTGSTIYLNLYDPISGTTLVPFSDDLPKTDKTYVTPTELCMGLWATNNNYSVLYNLVGYSLTQP